MNILANDLGNFRELPTTFFDFIGTADIERVHSATIAWMLSDKCEAFNLSERVDLLEMLFGTSSSDIKSIEGCAELEHIDIAFITEDSNGEKEIWVIENKIKAPLGHNQLKDYEAKIKKNKEYAKHHLAVLSLIGTLPQDDMKNWHIITYSYLLAGLDKILDKGHIDHQHYVIIKEYRDCLHNLQRVLNEFGKHPEKYPNVFTDGNKPKSEKRNIKAGAPIGNYISKNCLETLLQKYYFVDIINKIIEKGIKYGCHVSETRGNADFAFHFGYGGYKPDRVFDLSFQNGTFKFAVSDENYGSSRLPDPDPEKWPPELQNWRKAFEKVKNASKDYTRLNDPKTKIRISISYNVNKDGLKWYEWKRQDFIAEVIEQINQAEKMMRKVIDYHREQSETFQGQM